mmetsp:Transcript_72528/g.127873  ORF Transcript_72528/g.127873 Transcript_72528/m.127873 type:complete len:102 (-) Transcript_72528:82-387(-)
MVHLGFHGSQNVRGFHNLLSGSQNRRLASMHEHFADSSIWQPRSTNFVTTNVTQAVAVEWQLSVMLNARSWVSKSACMGRVHTTRSPMGKKLGRNQSTPCS